MWWQSIENCFNAPFTDSNDGWPNVSGRWKHAYTILPNTANFDILNSMNVHRKIDDIIEKKKCSKTMINSTVQLTKLWEQKWLKPWNCIYFSLKCGGDKRDYKWMPFKCCAELKYRFISLIHHFDHCLKWFYIISWARS